jgi:stage II sporulation protein D
VNRFRTAVLATLITWIVTVPNPVAATAKWVVHGAGFGHGVGLSAYGAYGYGKHGVGFKRILHHYFRQIRITELPRRRLITVLLSISSGDVRFTKATAACGRSLSASRSYRAHRSGSSVRLLSASGRRLTHCGKRLRAHGNGRIRIRGLGTYRDSLKVVPTASVPTSLNVINRLNVNDYVRGSVPGEVPPTWPMATLKAMAVAARSIGLSTDVNGHGFDLYADTRTQVYGGVKLETERTDKAVRATKNEVATYRHEIVQTTYFSSSGGRTESRFLGAPHVPYYKSVRDPYDYYAPLHRWTFRFSQAQIDARLGSHLRGGLRRIKVTQRGDSPRIDRAKLIGTRGTTKVRGDTLQRALGLYDRWAYFKRVKRG